MIFRKVRLIATENPAFTTLATIYGMKKAESDRLRHILKCGLLAVRTGHVPRKDTPSEQINQARGTRSGQQPALAMKKPSSQFTCNPSHMLCKSG